MFTFVFLRKLEKSCVGLLDIKCLIMYYGWYDSLSTSLYPIVICFVFAFCLHSHIIPISISQILLSNSLSKSLCSHFLKISSWTGARGSSIYCLALGDARTNRLNSLEAEKWVPHNRKFAAIKMRLWQLFPVHSTRPSENSDQPNPNLGWVHFSKAELNRFGFEFMKQNH